SVSPARPGRWSRARRHGDFSSCSGPVRGFDSCASLTRRILTMAEAKSRREGINPRPRSRPKPEFASGNGAEDGRHPEPEPMSEEPVAAATEAPRPASGERREQEFGAFDDEINNRYEEIKRGSTHISELQQMTMPQLLKIAKDEGLVDFTGMK